MVKKENSQYLSNSLLQTAGNKRLGAGKSALRALRSNVRAPVKRVKVLGSSDSRVSDLTGSIEDAVRPATVKEVRKDDFDVESSILGMSMNSSNSSGKLDAKRSAFPFSSVGVAIKTTPQPQQPNVKPTIKDVKPLQKKSLELQKGIRISAPSPMTLDRVQVQMGQEHSAPESREYKEIQNALKSIQEEELRRAADQQVKHEAKERLRQELEREQGEGFEAQLGDTLAEDETVKKKSLVKKILGKIRPKSPRKKQPETGPAQTELPKMEEPPKTEPASHRPVMGGPLSALEARTLARKALKSSRQNIASRFSLPRNEPNLPVLPITEVVMATRNDSISDLDASTKKFPVDEILLNNRNQAGDDESVSTLGTPLVVERQVQLNISCSQKKDNRDPTPTGEIDYIWRASTFRQHSNPPRDPEGELDEDAYPVSENESSKGKQNDSRILHRNGQALIDQVDTISAWSVNAENTAATEGTEAIEMRLDRCNPNRMAATSNHIPRSNMPKNYKNGMSFALGALCIGQQPLLRPVIEDQHSIIGDTHNGDIDGNESNGVSGGESIREGVKPREPDKVQNINASEYSHLQDSKIGRQSQSEESSHADHKSAGSRGDNFQTEAKSKSGSDKVDWQMSSNDCRTATTSSSESRKEEVGKLAGELSKDAGQTSSSDGTQEVHEVTKSEKRKKTLVSPTSAFTNAIDEAIRKVETQMREGDVVDFDKEKQPSYHKRSDLPKTKMSAKEEPQNIPTEQQDMEGNFHEKLILDRGEQARSNDADSPTNVVIKAILSPIEEDIELTAVQVPLSLRTTSSRRSSTSTTSKSLSEKGSPDDTSDANAKNQTNELEAWGSQEHDDEEEQACDELSLPDLEKTFDDPVEGKSQNVREEHVDRSDEDHYAKFPLNLSFQEGEVVQEGEVEVFSRTHSRNIEPGDMNNNEGSSVVDIIDLTDILSKSYDENDVSEVNLQSSCDRCPINHSDKPEAPTPPLVSFEDYMDIAAFKLSMASEQSKGDGRDDRYAIECDCDSPKRIILGELVDAKGSDSSLLVVQGVEVETLESQGGVDEQKVLAEDTPKASGATKIIKFVQSEHTLVESEDCVEILQELQYEVDSTVAGERSEVLASRTEINDTKKDSILGLVTSSEGESNEYENSSTSEAPGILIIGRNGSIPSTSERNRNQVYESIQNSTLEASSFEPFDLEDQCNDDVVVCYEEVDQGIEEDDVGGGGPEKESALRNAAEASSFEVYGDLESEGNNVVICYEDDTHHETEGPAQESNSKNASIRAVPSDQNSNGSKKFVGYFSDGLFDLLSMEESVSRRGHRTRKVPNGSGNDTSSFKDASCSVPNHDGYNSGRSLSTLHDIKSKQIASLPDPYGKKKRAIGDGETYTGDVLDSVFEYSESVLCGNEESGVVAQNRLETEKKCTDEDDGRSQKKSQLMDETFRRHGQDKDIRSVSKTHDDEYETDGIGEEVVLEEIDPENFEHQDWSFVEGGLNPSLGVMCGAVPLYFMYSGAHGRTKSKAPRKEKEKEEKYTRLGKNRVIKMSRKKMPSPSHLDIQSISYDDDIVESFEKPLQVNKTHHGEVPTLPKTSRSESAGSARSYSSLSEQFGNDRSKKDEPCLLKSDDDGSNFEGIKESGTKDKAKISEIDSHGEVEMHESASSGRDCHSNSSKRKNPPPTPETSRREQPEAASKRTGGGDIGTVMSSQTSNSFKSKHKRDIPPTPERVVARDKILLEKDDLYWDTLSTIASTRDKSSGTGNIAVVSAPKPGPIPIEITMTNKGLPEENNVDIAEEVIILPLQSKNTANEHTRTELVEDSIKKLNYIIGEDKSNSSLSYSLETFGVRQKNPAVEISSVCKDKTVGGRMSKAGSISADEPISGPPSHVSNVTKEQGKIKSNDSTSKNTRVTSLIAKFEAALSKTGGKAIFGKSTFQNVHGSDLSAFSKNSENEASDNNSSLLLAVTRSGTDENKQTDDDMSFPLGTTRSNENCLVFDGPKSASCGSGTSGETNSPSRSSNQSIANNNFDKPETNDTHNSAVGRSYDHADNGQEDKSIHKKTGSESDMGGGRHTTKFLSQNNAPLIHKNVPNHNDINMRMVEDAAMAHYLSRMNSSEYEREQYRHEFSSAESAYNHSKKLKQAVSEPSFTKQGEQSGDVTFVPSNDTHEKVRQSSREEDFLSNQAKTPMLRQDSPSSDPNRNEKYGSSRPGARIHPSSHRNVSWGYEEIYEPPAISDESSTASPFGGKDDYISLPFVQNRELAPSFKRMLLAITSAAAEASKRREDVRRVKDENTKHNDDNKFLDEGLSTFRVGQNLDDEKNIEKYFDNGMKGPNKETTTNTDQQIKDANAKMAQTIVPNEGASYFDRHQNQHSTTNRNEKLTEGTMSTGRVNNIPSEEKKPVEGKNIIITDGASEYSDINSDSHGIRPNNRYDEEGSCRDIDSGHSGRGLADGESGTSSHLHMNERELITRTLQLSKELLSTMSINDIEEADGEVVRSLMSFGTEDSHKFSLSLISQQQQTSSSPPHPHKTGYNSDWDNSQTRILTEVSAHRNGTNESAQLSELENVSLRSSMPNLLQAVPSSVTLKQRVHPDENGTYPMLENEQSQEVRLSEILRKSQGERSPRHQSRLFSIRRSGTQILNPTPSVDVEREILNESRNVRRNIGVFPTPGDFSTTSPVDVEKLFRQYDTFAHELIDQNDQLKSRQKIFSNDTESGSSFTPRILNRLDELRSQRAEALARFQNSRPGTIDHYSIGRGGVANNNSSGSSSLRSERRDHLKYYTNIGAASIGHYSIGRGGGMGMANNNSSGSSSLRSESRDHLKYYTSNGAASLGSGASAVRSHYSQVSGAASYSSSHPYLSVRGEKETHRSGVHYSSSPRLMNDRETDSVSTGGSSRTTPSRKARDLRRQLDEALQASKEIRITQEKLGTELRTFKDRFYPQNGQIHGQVRRVMERGGGQQP